MQGRILLAVFLSFLVLYVYQALIIPPPSPSPIIQEQATNPAVTVGEQTAIPDVQSQSVPLVSPGVTTIDQIIPTPTISDNELKEIVVESNAFRAVFTNRGAELLSWQLKDHLDDVGQPVELVPLSLPPEEPWPLSLAFEDENLTRFAHEALYRVNTTNLQLDDRTDSLDFDYENSEGLRISKTLEFDPATDPYGFRLTVQASTGGVPLVPTMKWGPALGGVESQVSGIAYREGPRGVIYGRVLENNIVQEPDVVRVSASQAFGQSVYQGQMAFLGVDNHYFIAVALPGMQEASIQYRPVPLPPHDPDGDPRDLMAFDLTVPGGITSLPMFLGPKDFDILQASNPNLVRAIEFGWFSWLVVPLHKSLTWVHSYVGNYGWSIIILTLIINVIIFPLRHKSVVSMRKMQKIQPEVKAIQERYKNMKMTEKQKMNQEIMSLYRDRGVNPASGCLPMLLTMPILFAFYRLLSMAIEIRGAPFIAWITDLSAHDPMYITPIVMGASMVLQQRMTPSQADPMQQKMMMLMPIVFTALFLYAPAGLVLYWLTSNAIAIGQQAATNRFIPA